MDIKRAGSQPSEKGPSDYFTGVVRIDLPAESFARAVAFAIGQPDEMDVNEILFRPTLQEW